MDVQECRILIEQLEQEHHLTKQEYEALLCRRFVTAGEAEKRELDRILFEKACNVRNQIFGKQIYIRGLIEFTNHCRNNCYYCGLRRDNHKVERYRLEDEQILDCCEEGYALGFRTFVLQGGEDLYFTDEKISLIVRAVKARFPDCAVTLSLGERSRESYRLWYQAGVDRYLLRHETADCFHYRWLHPLELSLETRMQCLRNLKEIGYQVGAGFMVGSPGQTFGHLAEDMLFLLELQPHMIGIGPFIPHQETPFAGKPCGSVELTLFMLALLRLTFPKVLLPATTALSTLAEDGRKQGILAGANVIMPNLSPEGVREQYCLYDNKKCTNEESAQSVQFICEEMQKIGYEIIVGRGDHPDM